MSAGSPQPEWPAAEVPSAALAEDDTPALPEHLTRGPSRPAPDAGPSKKYKPP
ncbi:hypothetical protein MNEG_13912, partial [Monoraphidium neglectum]